MARKAATAEVLQVINSSPGDLAPVFDAMLDKALELCGAAFGTLWTREGEFFHAAALRRVPVAYAEFLAKGPVRTTPGANSGLGSLLDGKALFHLLDASAEPAYQVTTPERGRRLNWGRPHHSRCAVAQARRNGRCHHDLSPGGEAVQRQTDRAVPKFRGTGSHRDGKRAAAGRIA